MLVFPVLETLVRGGDHRLRAHHQVVDEWQTRRPRHLHGGFRRGRLLADGPRLDAATRATADVPECSPGILDPPGGSPGAPVAEPRVSKPAAGNDGGGHE